MEVDRRSLMKGLLAGGALLALGTPPPWVFATTPTRKPDQCLLLLGGTQADDGFAKGVRAAYSGRAQKTLQVARLRHGLLRHTDSVAFLLSQSKGTRWIAVMDDASAMVFLELVRSAGGRLLSMGAHACSNDAGCRLRHTWGTTSPMHSPGGLLAAHLLQQQHSFSITESFVQSTPEDSSWTSWSAPGFSSYRITEPEAIHIHCSGLSLLDSGRKLELDTTQGWVPIPRQVCARDSVIWRSENWVESVGYVVTASALGVDSVRESCSRRVFMHQSGGTGPEQPTERFLSFVLDL
jgi:hypothetical protein